MKNLSQLTKNILGYTISILILITIISIIFICSGRLMLFFGFKYNSIISIFIYFGIVTIISIPIDSFTQAFPKALKSLRKINRITEIVLFLLLDTIGTGIIMSLVDYFMDSVSASDLAIFIISFILAIFSLDIN